MRLSATVVHYMIQISCHPIASLHIRCDLVKFCRCFVEFQTTSVHHCAQCSWAQKKLGEMSL